MEIRPIFSVGVGIVDASSYLPIAREMFAMNKDILINHPQTEGFKTSLKSYFSCSGAEVRRHKPTQNAQMLVEFIKEKAIEYLEESGYDIDKYKVEVDKIWLNEMDSRGCQDAHPHYGATVSGCFYVDIPYGSGRIDYENPLQPHPLSCVGKKEETQYNAYGWYLTPYEGAMLFWGSNIVHNVPKLEYTGLRRTLAFDIVITGCKY